MNIMLATVRARIREIGNPQSPRRHLSRRIKLQFLAEAVIISLTGGLVGVIVGLIVPFPSGYLRTTRCRSPGSRSSSPWPRPSSVGVVFGTVPATRAAQLDPVEGLKYE